MNALQSCLGYRNVLERHKTLLLETISSSPPRRKEMQNIIALAKRLADSKDLDRGKRSELEGVIDTWQKHLKESADWRRKNS